MFDFNLEFERVEDTSSYAFVGIYKNKQGKTVFRVPKGLNIARYQTFADKRDLFFRLYRVLRKFSHVLGQNTIQAKDDRVSNQNIYSAECSHTIELGDGQHEEVTYYNHFHFLEKLLDTYDELKIFNLAAKERPLNHIAQHHRIHLYLDRAIFLEEDDKIYTFVDQMHLPAPQIVFSETDLITMYCYLVIEIKQQITPNEKVHPDVDVLAHAFKEKYLTPDESLFAETTWRSTLQTLKECLEHIKRFTVYKSPDFWEFYDAIELFLYGKFGTKNEEGYLWGLNNFAFVWEAMCLTHSIKNTPEKIRYLDTQCIEQTILPNKKLLDSNIFRFTRLSLKKEIETTELILKAKTLRPDLVLEENIKWVICDIKYYTFDELKNIQKHNKHVAEAIRKQYVYEYLLQEHLGNNIQIESEFWLPSEEEHIEYFGPLKLVYKSIDQMIDEYSR